MASETLEIFSGTYGFRITIGTGRDLSASTSLRLRVRKPDNSNVNRSLDSFNILEPKTDGRVYYDTVADDFTMPGTYQFQLFDETGGIRLASQILKIKVKPSLDYIQA